jgi:hypothetical protein
MRVSTVIGGVLVTLVLSGGRSSAAITIAEPRLAVKTPAGIIVVDRGLRTHVAGSVAGDAEPAWSPDGRRLAVSRWFGRDREIVILDLLTGGSRRLTYDSTRHDVGPAWSPDGRRIVWSRGRTARWDVWIARADGRGARPFVQGPGSQRDPAFSRNGARLVYASNESGDFDLFVRSVTGGRPKALLRAKGDQRRPVWSPDGTRLAFTSGGAEGTLRLSVLTAGKAKARVRGVAASTRPSWSRDGDAVIVELTGRRHAIIAVDPDRGPGRPLPGLVAGERSPVYGPALAGPRSQPDEVLPDLDQRAPAGLVVRVVGGRRKLGFHSAVDNIGSGVLRIVGRRETVGDPVMEAVQLVDLVGGGRRVYARAGRLDFEPHAPHRHWHFEPFERYELRRASDHALVARDQKAGFCLTDRYGHAASRVRVPVVARFAGNCGQGRRDILRVVQGSSPGFTDRYPAWFHGQEIDITDVPPGAYVLVHRANPELRVHERRYDNNTASARIRLTKTGALEVERVCEESERCDAPPVDASR